MLKKIFERMTCMKKKLKNLVLFTSLSVCGIHLLNKFLTFTATIRELLKTELGYYYEWRFGKIYYTKQGKGSPLLLIHDLTTGSSSYEWNELISKLSENHTVYAIDLLGCGRSAKPNLTYTNFLYVQLISDFIKNIIGHKTDVLVTGDSSPLVVTACSNDETLFNKVVMINPTSLYKLNEIPSKRTKTLKLLIETPILGTLLYNIYALKTNVENKFVEKYFFNPFKVTDAHINTYYEASNLGNAKYLFASIKGRYTNMNIIHALKNINHSLFIIGGSDEEDIKTTIDNYSYYNPSIESYIIPKTKHLPHFESPKGILEQIEIFLE